jgi:hypothetical protein
VTSHQELTDTAHKIVSFGKMMTANCTSWTSTELCIGWCPIRPSCKFRHFLETE